MEQYTFLSRKPPVLGAATCSATSMQLLWITCSGTACKCSFGRREEARAPFGIPGQRIKDDFCFQPKTRANLHCQVTYSFSSLSFLQTLASAWAGFLWHLGLLSFSSDDTHLAHCHGLLVCHVAASNLIPTSKGLSPPLLILHVFLLTAAKFPACLPYYFVYKKTKRSLMKLSWSCLLSSFLNFLFTRHYKPKEETLISCITCGVSGGASQNIQYGENPDFKLASGVSQSCGADLWDPVLTQVECQNWTELYNT